MLASIRHNLLVFLSFALYFYSCSGILFPQDSESRQSYTLNGLWNFRVDSSIDRYQGFREKWYNASLCFTGPVISMPVPSSFNDVTTDTQVQNFIGWAWYDRFFFTPTLQMNERLVLRIDSAHYYAIVWINGVEVTRHVGGHLPFETQLEYSSLKQSGKNLITIAVNNTLTPKTLPPGSIHYHSDTRKYPKHYFTQTVNFDFFNYAGIHRNIYLYSTPVCYIDDITIKTDITGSTGTGYYNISTKGCDKCDTNVIIQDKFDQPLKYFASLRAAFLIPHAHFWWPYTLNETDAGYQYTLKIILKDMHFGTSDVFRQKFGIRKISIHNTTLLINEKLFYCHGVNKHEDSDIRGKGLDLPLIMRDFNLMKWLGANCFRTSHYPYAEEIMDEADKLGFVVIDESPGVGIIYKENMELDNLQHHMNVMMELISRDKNRPSVIAWSLANEPNSALPEANLYFKSLSALTRKLDDTRLVTFVDSSSYNSDHASQYMDFLCINRYFGWYSDSGHLEVIEKHLDYDLNSWYEKFKKPIILSEFGADCIPGFQTLPSQMFTENFQVDFLKHYHDVLDKYRSKFVIGELVWNFADFMTVQGVTRVVGNKKGIFTRQRQPKMAAHMIRDRYMKLINETNR